MVGVVLMMLVLFLLFLAPFDRRIIERFLLPPDGEPVGPAPLEGDTRTRKPAMDDGPRTSATGGPYTRQLCHMIDLEVVFLRDFSSPHAGLRLMKLAIGRWNEEAQEFEVVTEWCDTWEDLEEEARRAVKSFQGIADPKYRGASNI